MVEYIEFYCFIAVIIILGMIIQIFVGRKRQSHVMDSPSDIAMVRLLYMYKDMMAETDQIKKIQKLDVFEDTLLEFLDKYEEQITEEEKELICSKVSYLSEFKKVGQ